MRIINANTVNAHLPLNLRCFLVGCNAPDLHCVVRILDFNLELLISWYLQRNQPINVKQDNGARLLLNKSPGT